MTSCRCCRETRQVFMVVGSGCNRQILASATRGAIQALSGPPDICLVRRSVLLRNLASRARAFRTTPQSIYLTFGTDAAGAAYADERVIAELHADGECATVRGAQRVFSAPESSAAG